MHIYWIQGPSVAVIKVREVQMGSHYTELEMDDERPSPKGDGFGSRL